MEDISASPTRAHPSLALLPVLVVAATWLGVDLQSGWGALMQLSPWSAWLAVGQLTLASLGVGAGAAVLVTALLAISSGIARRTGRTILGAVLVAVVAAAPIHGTLGAISNGAWLQQQAWLAPVRWLVFVLSLLAVAWIWGETLRTLHRGGRRLSLMGKALSLLGILLLVADPLVLVGRQMGFHLFLSSTAIAILALGTSLIVSSSTARRRRGPPIALAAMGLLSLSLFVFGWLPAGELQSRGFLYSDAVLTGRLLRQVRPATEAQPNADANLLLSLQRSSRVAPSLLDERFPYRRDANIIVITVDTLRADAVGLHGNRQGLTPCLDAFGKNSIVFDNAYTQHPSSQLAMASLFKGLYPLATDVFASLEPDVFGNNSPLHQPMLAERLRDAGRETVAVTAFDENLRERLFGYLNAGFDRFNDYPHEELLGASVVEAHALEALDALGEKPFYLWVHLFDPHSPYDPPEATRGNSPRQLYDAEVAHADASVGRILEAASRRDDWDKTIVVIHSDHGEEFEEHGGFFHHSTLFEEQIRVPFVIRIPGQTPARVSAPVELMDLPETIYNLLDLEPLAVGHGQSLLPWIIDDVQHAAMPSPIAFAQFHGPGQRVSRLDGVRAGKWKLIHDVISGTDRLFDLEEDPHEQHNLAHSSGVDLARMREWLAACGAVVRGERKSQAITDLSDPEIMPALSRLEPGEQKQALAQLIVAGRIDPILPLLTQFIQPNLGIAESHAAMRLTAIRQWAPALQRIILMLEAGGAREKSAALFLGHYDAPEILDALNARLAHYGDKTPWWIHVARGIQGDSDAEAAIRAFAPDLEDTTATVYRELALSVLNPEIGRCVINGLIENIGLAQDLQLLCIAIIARFEPAVALPWVHLGASKITMPYPLMLRIIHLARSFPPEVSAPISRLMTEQVNASIRDLARQQIEALGPAPEADWGTVYSDFTDDVTNNSVTGKQVPLAGEHLHGFQQRLNSFRSQLMKPAVLTIRALGPVPGSLRVGTQLALPLEVTAEADSGAVLGGPIDEAASFHVSFRNPATGESIGASVFRIPSLGLLRGESARSLTLIRIPSDIASHATEMVIRMRSHENYPATCNELVFPVAIK